MTLNCNLTHDLYPWFSRSNFEKVVLSNGMPDWHGTKGMWVDRMLDPHCDFELWPHPWPWPLIFKVKFWKCQNSGMGCPIDMEWKGCESTECWTHVMTFNFDLTYDLDLEFSTSNFEIAVSRPGMAGPIDMERKGYESIVCYTYFVTLSYDLDLGFSRSNFKNAVSQEWEGRLTWNQRDVSR